MRNSWEFLFRSAVFTKIRQGLSAAFEAEPNSKIKRKRKQKTVEIQDTGKVLKKLTIFCLLSVSASPRHSAHCSAPQRPPHFSRDSALSTECRLPFFDTWNMVERLRLNTKVTIPSEYVLSSYYCSTVGQRISPNALCWSWFCWMGVGEFL